MVTANELRNGAQYLRREMIESRHDFCVDGLRQVNIRVFGRVYVQQEHVF